MYWPSFLRCFLLVSLCLLPSGFLFMGEGNISICFVFSASLDLHIFKAWLFLHESLVIHKVEVLKFWKFYL